MSHIAVTTASDVDGSLDLLALPEAVEPQTWVVTVVPSDGSRTPAAASGVGAGGTYPRFVEQPHLKFWWSVDGFDDCHAEISSPASGDTERVRLRSTAGRCPDCQARAARG